MLYCKILMLQNASVHYRVNLKPLNETPTIPTAMESSVGLWLDQLVKAIWKSWSQNAKRPARETTHNSLFLSCFFLREFSSVFLDMVSQVFEDDFGGLNWKDTYLGEERWLAWLYLTYIYCIFTLVII